MQDRTISLSRRRLLQAGGATLAGLRLFELEALAQGWGAGEGERIVPFLDPTPEPPQPGLRDVSKLSWQDLQEWVTPVSDFFEVAHYGRPEMDLAAYRLEIGGLVESPRRLTLSELRALPRREVAYTLECAGNDGFPWFVGGIGNARWAGTPLAPLLRQAAPLEEAIEVVFFGHDGGEEEFGGRKVPQTFARSMSLADALDPELLLCYEMNGEPLPAGHGAPLRLIAPGWYGIANVKWLDRIEVWSRRYAGRFMARDYVTVREEPRRGGGSVFTQKVVGRTLLKSVPARVTERDGRYRVYGAAWGGPIERVEVRIDEGTWQPATIGRGSDEKFAWKFWHYDWTGASPGEHSVTSRVVGRGGRMQPPSDDPSVAGRLTYWENNGQITRRVAL